MARFINDPLSGQLVPVAEQASVDEQCSRLVDWQQRDRPRVDATIGYSRFVRIMKVMLPLRAFSLIVLVVVYSTMRRKGANVAITYTGVVDLENDRQLVGPKLTGTDGRG